MNVTDKSIVKSGELLSERERLLVLAAEDAEHASAEGLELKVATSYRSFRRFFFLMAMVIVCFVGTNYAIRTRRDQGGTKKISGVMFPGTCHPSAEVRVSMQALGTVEEILVQPGQIVEPGETLLKLNDQEAEAALREAELQRSIAVNNLSALRTNYARSKTKLVISQQQEQLLPKRQLRDSPERARALYEQALKSYNRVFALVDLGVLAQQELDTRAVELRLAKDDLDNAQKLDKASSELALDQIEQVTVGSRVDRDVLEQEFKRADLSYQECKRRVAQAQVQSPVRAVVAEVEAHVGERLSAGVLVIRLAELDKMVVEVPVAAEMISQLKVRQAALVQLPTIPVQEVQGFIRTINPLPTTNMTHSVRVEFENAELKLLAGQPAKVTFLEP